MLRVLLDGPSCGHALTQALAVAGLGEVKDGTLYPLLGWLEDAGTVEVDWRPGEGGPGRKLYALTSQGRSRRTTSLTDGPTSSPRREPHQLPARESGEEAESTSGDPRDYARALAGDQGAPRLQPLTVVSLLLGLVGMLLAFPSWLAGTAVAVRGGLVVVGAVLAVLTCTLLADPGPALRLVVQRRWVGILLVQRPELGRLRG